MKYTTKVMLPDERLLFDGSVHWIVYWQAAVCLVLAVLTGGFLVVQQPRDSMYEAYVVVILVFLVLALFFAFRAWLRRVTTEMAVTDRRVIFKRGLLTRHTEEMNISKIETVDVDQSLLGRLLGYGNVTLRGTGATWEPLLRVGHPLEFRSAIMVG